ncbi:NEDD4-binding protein 2 isoform X2 [Eucyclogobius newberryi]|uniref:NEDD4-binding protein 2 isoform X2 n=1 Tax=Eucyclogobius newberryi TaxID=166745 RepID=UPI003B5B46E0
MPRKKKGGQSPARVPSGQQLEGGTNTGHRLPPMASNFLPGSSPSTSAKEDIVRNMREMFSHLDPEVIYIVLSESDFKVEHAMDALLELSVAATDPQPLSSTVSGFEKTAAALLTPHHFAEPQSQTDQLTHLQCSSTSPTYFMTEDLDFLIDQEVQSISAQENIKVQLLDNTSHLQNSGASSPLDQLSKFEEIYNVVDEQVPAETSKDKDILSVDLIMPGQPSAFQAYKKQNNTSPTEGMVAEDVPKSGPSHENMVSSASLNWNLEAAAFQPHVQENHGSAFITPVVSGWPRGPRHTMPWHRPNSQAHLRAHPPIPRSWALPPPRPPGPSSRLHLEGIALVLLRGPPGSGKSTLARALLEHNPGGLILSTDDYFLVNGEYCFDPALLGEAHTWNHSRARQAFEGGINPIIIDNTNMCGWEMRPYVIQALKHSYKVLFKEPDTWWKNKPRELERRTKHCVPLEKIQRMLCGYERFVTVSSILGSEMPERKQQAVNETEELLEPEVPCLDIVRESSVRNAHSEAVPALPDVSTTHESFKDKQENADQDMGESVKTISDTKDHCPDEWPIAFSASIAQRMKRERAGRKPGVDNSEPADESKNPNKSAEEVLSRQEEIAAKESTKSVVRMLDFEGDWPATASLDQRQERRHGRPHDNDNRAEKAMNDSLSAVSPSARTEDMPKPDLTELLKLFDLIQTGADPLKTDSSSLSPLSASSGDNDVSCAQRSQSEINERITGELPDCVFDSQAAECSSAGVNDLDLYQGASPNATGCREVSESPEFESLGESDGSQIRDASGSQEHKQRHARRSGKQCKLALTFTQNCLEASVDCAESSAEAPANDERDPELRTSFTETNMMAVYESRPSSFTQTESLDFALLWRVNQNSLDTSNNDFGMLCSNPARFLPEMSSTAASNSLTDHKEVPYSVVHEKGTQVEEKEFGTSKDVTENLLILRRHFKRVTLDTLEDLYEKCHQDLEWTTNLLLDSGERFFRDDEIEDEESGRSSTECEDGSSSESLDTPQYEELTGAGPDVVVEEIQTDAVSETCQNSDSNECDLTAASSILDDNLNSQDDDDKGNHKTLPQIKESSSSLNLNTTLGGTRPCGGAAYDGSLGGAERVDGLAVEIEDDISSMNEVHRLLQAELEELEREEKEREDVLATRKDVKQKKKQLMDIKSVELKLPTELALQLTELFGPVGFDPDTGSTEDCVLQMDLNLAKLLHQKWKESIQERKKQAALSFQLLQESSAHWSKPQQWAVAVSNPGGYQKIRDFTSHRNPGDHLPFMDHWNVSRPHVSLRDIIKEETVLQHSRENARQSQTDLDKRDGATLLKEDQLFALFPTIDRHFLQDIFRDHNYSLKQTELFLRSLLDGGPVKTVVAPEAPQIAHPRSASKDREMKFVETVTTDYQDTEDPEYQDFRAEANLQRRRQLESFAKAAEAYKQGHKEVASFYAQQGHLHGQRMREANHRAAVQIFQRVNSSLLPQNILDLHGLHVDEALEHLTDILEQKTTECERGLCRPQLSVITGRGNHSQGGVARIRPAVLDYLTNKHYRFTEPKPGLVLVSLK